MTDYAGLRAAFRDVAFTTATPFTDGGDEVDHEALAANLRAIRDAGARLFIPCGNTGEYYALTDEERIAVVEAHVDAVGGDDEVTIVGGLNGSVPTARDLADAYAAAGADAVMVMHPDHTYAHEEGLIDYYEAIADHTDLGVVLYKRGPDVSRRVLTTVVERENVVAVKFAVDDVTEFSRTIADAEGEATWVNGIAERYALAFAVEGAEGFTTGIGNFVPEATLALQDAIRAEDWERARELRDLLRPYEDLREETGANNHIANANNVPAVKYGMELAGLTGGPLRAPLVGLSDADRERAEEYYAAIDDAAL